MKSVLVPSLTLLMATITLACVFVWTGFSGESTAFSAGAADGYYITEFQRAGH